MPLKGEIGWHFIERLTDMDKKTIELALAGQLIIVMGLYLPVANIINST